MTDTLIYGDICKWRDQPDGSMIVEGVATSEAIDLTGEIIDYESAKASFAAWPGNVREQHDALKPVGRAVGFGCDDATKTIHLTAMISAGRPDTQAMIRDGTLKGFSIRAAVTGRAVEVAKTATGSRSVTRIYIGAMREVSVVDVPCNPEATISVAKAYEGATIMPDALKAYLGDEVWDAQRAIDALSTIMCVYAGESNEPGEPSQQVLDLREAIARIKAFIASEILEDNDPATTPATQAVDDATKSGKRISAATQSKIDAAKKKATEAADAHRAAAKAHDDAVAALDGISADDGKGDDAQKSAPAPTSSLSDAEADEVLKSLALPATKTGALGLTEALLTHTAQLQDELTRLRAMPAPPKGAVMAVSKAADGVAAGAPPPAPPEVPPTISGVPATLAEQAAAVRDARANKIINI